MLDIDRGDTRSSSVYQKLAPNRTLLYSDAGNFHQTQPTNQTSPLWPRIDLKKMSPL